MFRPKRLITKLLIIHSVSIAMVEPFDLAALLERNPTVEQGSLFERVALASSAFSL